VKKEEGTKGQEKGRESKINKESDVLISFIGGKTQVAGMGFPCIYIRE